MSVTPGAPEYALELSDAERGRYRAMARRAREQEGERWQRYGVVPGARIADVGCGPGAVLVELAELVAPGGSVSGVEPNAQARAAATEEIRARGVDNASVVAGDGTATTLEPATYDLVMIRHVLFHVGDRVHAVLEHAATLLRPGGHLYTVDVDMTGRRISVSDDDFDEQARRYEQFQRARGNNVDIGPRLGPLLVATGLELREHEAIVQNVPGALLVSGGPMLAARHEMIAAGVITEDDARRFDAAAQRVATTPNLRLFFPHYLAVGRKP